MHMRRQSSRICPFVLVISCLLLAGCGPPPLGATPTFVAPTVLVPTSTSAPKSSTPSPTNTPLHIAGVLHLAVREDVKTLNPYLVSNASEEFVVSLLYDTLLDYNLRKGLGPNLAERWELSSDGVSLTFWLNPQARWHHGPPVIAKDVVFSFNLVRQEQFPGLVRVAALVDRVEAISPKEVRFVLLKKQADAVHLLGTQLRIVPASLWEKVSDPLHYSNLENPAGSGPFLLLERGDEGQLVLRNTRTHHCTMPRIDTLVLDISHDEDAALEALQDGDLDALGWDVVPYVASDVRDNPDSYASIKLAEAPGMRTHTLLFDLRKAPYDNRAFRQGLAQAIDAQAIIDAALAGFGDAATPGLFPPASPWRNTSITPLAGDPQQASKELEAAGFLDRDGDGLRENPDGSALQIPITCSDLPISVRVAELVAANWQSVGIQVKVEALAQDLMVPTLMQAQFGVILHSVSLNEPEMAFFYFHTSRGLIKNGRVSGFNYGGYANPQYDDVATISWEEQEPARRRELLYQLQEILARDLPQIPLYIPRVLNLHRDDRFVGWSTEPGVGLVNRTTIANLCAVGGSWTDND